MPVPEQSVQNFMRKRWIPNEEALASWVLQVGEDLAASDSGLPKATLSNLVNKHFPAGADSLCTPENFGLGCVVEQNEANFTNQSSRAAKEIHSVNELNIAEDARLPLEHRIDLPLIDESTSQGNIGSCVSWAGAHAMENAISNADGRYSQRINPSAIYGFIKGNRLDPWPEEHGSTLDALATALYRCGAPPWDSMPVYRSAPDKNPANLPHPSDVVKKASKNRTAESAWITEWNDTTLYEAMCLMKGEYESQPSRELTICTAFHIPASFFNAYTAKTGIVMMPPSNDRMLGGHAVVLIGWKQINNHRYFIVKNSWGTSFGDEGYLYVPEVFIKTYFKHSFVIPTLQRELVEQEAIASRNTRATTTLTTPFMLGLLIAAGCLAYVHPGGLKTWQTKRLPGASHVSPGSIVEAREEHHPASRMNSERRKHKSEPLDKETLDIYVQILHMLNETR